MNDRIDRSPRLEVYFTPFFRAAMIAGVANSMLMVVWSVMRIGEGDRFLSWIILLGGLFHLASCWWISPATWFRPVLRLDDEAVRWRMPGARHEESVPTREVTGFRWPSQYDAFVECGMQFYRLPVGAGIGKKNRARLRYLEERWPEHQFVRTGALAGAEHRG